MIVLKSVPAVHKTVARLRFGCYMRKGRLKKLLLAVTLSFILMPNANAEKIRMWSGNSWLIPCNEEAGNSICESYTEGVIEGWYFGYAQGKYDLTGDKALTPESSTPFCLPASGSTKQYVQVVKKYMEAHPEVLHMPAAYLIYRAMYKAFPCTRN